METQMVKNKINGCNDIKNGTQGQSYRDKNKLSNYYNPIQTPNIRTVFKN